MTAEEVLVKTPYEERLFNFDFSADLDTGETVSGSPQPVITITPSGQLLAQTPVVSGAIVQSKFTGGTAGVKYHVSCQVVTSTQKRELCGDLYVEAC